MASSNFHNNPITYHFTNEVYLPSHVSVKLKSPESKQSLILDSELKPYEKLSQIKILV